MKINQTLLLGIMLLSASSAFAHGNSGHEKSASVQAKDQKAWGIAGDVGKVGRTIKVDMRDTMRFSPDTIKVRRGETLRLSVTNSGQVMHEFVLGTRAYIAEHAELMRRFPTMEHDEPHMVHVSPGKTGEIVWTFDRVGEFDFACLLPGHYESGMTGKIVVIDN